jgi:hypothetical protein
MTILGGLGAVYATNKTREGIYDGLMARHCYATTGSRIYLNIEVDGHPMGTAFKAKTQPRITGTVHGTAPLESISIFNRSEELQRLAPNPPVSDGRRLMVAWTGANSPDRGRFMDWSGEIRLTGGTILNVTSLNMFAAKYGIRDSDANRVAWNSVTSGQEEGLLLEVDAPDDAVIAFAAGPADINFSLGEARNRDLDWEFGGLEQALRATTRHCEGDEHDATFDFVDENAPAGECAYWVRVVQADFHRAWSSPVYVDIEVT